MRVIYGLCDPRVPKRVRYVGCTKLGGLSERLAEHVYEAKTCRANGHRGKWIRKLLREGVEPTISVIEEVDDARWQERERWWIACLRPQLVNETDGGEGLVNPSVDVRRRIARKVSLSLAGNGRRKGVPHSAEDRQRISDGVRSSEKYEAAIARLRTDPEFQAACRRNIAKAITAVRGSKWTEERRARRSAEVGDFVRQMSKDNVGSRWCNDGNSNRLLRPGEDLPNGFSYGRLMVGRPSASRGQKMPASFGESIRRTITGHRLITDGVVRTRLHRGEALPSGWTYVNPKPGERHG